MPPASDTERPTVAETVHFASGPYRLHGELAYPEAGRPAGAAVLAGPHPLLGGNMDNNVVRALAAGLAERGLVTLRFDYRGVGRSEGPAVDVAAHLARFWETSHVPDEMAFAEDVQASAALVAEAAPDVPRALIGYSFGCALLPYVRVPGPSCPRVLIAPTVGKHDYDPYRAVDGPLLVIASEDDFATDCGRLRAWFDGLGAGRQLILRRFDNHFFRGHEGWLVEAVFAFLREHWGE
jgi:alpha/beta superfamily hydrolase